jgi:hypothetical protein
MAVLYSVQIERSDLLPKPLYNESEGYKISMSYRNKTYVAFDGDNDIWAYRLMTAWCEHDHIDFNFYNAHDLNNARDTSSEESIKAQLRLRMSNAKQMILLVGQNTKYLRKFVPWEIELACKKDIPVIVANLNKQRTYDADLCPLAIGSEVYTMHVAFYAKIIQYTLDNFAEEYQEYKNIRVGNYRYKDSVYEELGL